MRPKPFLTSFILCAIPLLLLAALNYWNGVRTVESTLGAIVQNDLNSFNVAVDEVLDERKHEILGFAIERVVQNTLAKKERTEIVADFSPYFQTVALFDKDRKPFCFQKGSGEWTFTNLESVNLPQPDQRLWTSPGNTLFENPGSTDGTMIYSAPVNDGKTDSNLGAVVGVLDLQRVFASASRGLKLRSNKLVVTDRAGKTVYGDTLP